MVNVKEVADYVAANNCITKATALQCVKDVFAFIRGELEEGSEVNIDKFGKFYVEHKAERNGRNPATGQPLTIAAKTVAKFKPAKDLRDSVA